MKTIQIITFTMLILAGCENQDIALESKLGASPKFSYLTWELMEIRNLNGEWTTVKPEEKHYLTFLNDKTISYMDAQKTCDGQYAFETLENSIVQERLTLKVPCMVPAEQLWWEYLIEEKSENEVITYPQLIPTALMTYQRFKYRIIKPDNL